MSIMNEEEWQAKVRIMEHFGNAWERYEVRIEVHEARMRGQSYVEIAERVTALPSGRRVKGLTRESVRAALARLKVAA